MCVLRMKFHQNIACSAIDWTLFKLAKERLRDLSPMNFIYIKNRLKSHTVSSILAAQT